MAERAILAIGRQDWRDAEALVEQARSVVATAHLEDCATSVVLYAAGPGWPSTRVTWARPSRT